MQNLMLSLLLALLPAVAAGQNKLPTPKPPQFEASSYILMDFHSGQVVAEREPDNPVEPASITKLMTAYIVFSELSKGNVSLADEVNVSRKAWKAIGSRMFIEVGSKVSIEQLLHGMIIQSGNDASIALAEHLAGGEDTFAAWMTQYAQKLGMVNTHFMNATGLSHEMHYSTARDIALLARAIITEFPEYYAYYSKKEYTYNDITQPNRNRLLWRDSSVDGMKTGYTKAAGYCLASSAERDGMRLISVVLGTPSVRARINSSEALLNYGFRFFETIKVADRGQPVTETRTWKGASDTLTLGTAGPVWVTIPRGRRGDLEVTPSLPQRVIAPILAGTEIGSLQVSHGGQPLRTEPLIAQQDVPLGGIMRRLTDEIVLFFKR